MSDNEPATRTPRCPTPYPSPLTGCGSTNVVGPDDEGLYDCKDCGLWFIEEVAMGQSSHDALIAALKSLLDVPWGPDTFAAAQDTFANAQETTVSLSGSQRTAWKETAND